MTALPQAVTRAFGLDEKGRCCGRKPLVYKRYPAHLFCDRCCRAYDPATGKQMENWAWTLAAEGNEFVRVRPRTTPAAHVPTIDEDL